VQEVFRRPLATSVSGVRRFFDERDYVEVETRMLLPQSGGAAARPFVTRHNALGVELFLRIATNSISSGWWWAAWTGCTKSAASSATRHGPLSQSRVHLDRVLSGLRDLRRSDDADRRAARAIAVDVCGQTEISYKDKRCRSRRPFVV